MGSQRTPVLGELREGAEPSQPRGAQPTHLCADCRWERASQATAERQQKLEESANQLASFQAAEAQLQPWLMEKELMMSVLGPLSIDPNMLNAQKQQVQVSWSYITG